MKRAMGIVLSAVLTFCSGCWPEHEIVWSADGQLGVLAGGNDLQFIDAQGKVLPGLVKGGHRAAWASDSRTLFAAVARYVATWEQARVLLTPQQQAEVALEARLLAERVKTLPKDQWQEQDLFQEGKSDYFLTVLLCLRDQHAGVLDKLLSDKERQELREFTVPYYTIVVVSLQGGQVSPAKELAGAFGQVHSLRAHPKGLAVAVVAGQQLRVVLQTRDVVEVANPAAKYPDWTADGQALCYVAGQDPRGAKERSQLGTLRLHRIFDQAGQRVKETAGQDAQPPAVRELAGVLFHPTARVRCLSDGRILFTGVKATLPCPPDAMQPGIFAIDPARGPGITDVLPSGSLKQLEGFLLDLMELSPDQTRIALPTEKGRIAVAALANGEVRVMQDQDLQEPIIRPTWRTNDEVTFLAPPPAGQDRGPVVVYSLSNGKTRILSETWPAQVMERWLGGQEKK